MEILNVEMVEIELPVTVSILFYDFFIVAATKGKAELIEWLEGDVFAKVARPQILLPISTPSQRIFQAG